MKLWAVGKVTKHTGEGAEWEIMGIYDCEQKAVGTCKDESYFVGPLMLNETLPDDSLFWIGAYYPRNAVTP